MILSSMGRLGRNSLLQKVEISTEEANLEEEDDDTDHSSDNECASVISEGEEEEEEEGNGSGYDESTQATQDSFLEDFL